MDARRLWLSRLALFTLAICGAAVIVGITPVRADEVTDWNAVAIDVLVLGGQNPVVITRGLAMLTLRKADGATVQVAYTPGTQPGQWRPHPNPVPANPPIADTTLAPGNLPAMLPQWGQMLPFTMRAPWQFRLRPPPALTSET